MVEPPLATARQEDLGRPSLDQMPPAVPRPSLSAEAARAAVLTAEFNEKRWVWVPDDKEGYIAAWVIREHDEIGDVMLAGGSEVCFSTYASCSVPFAH